MLFCMTIYELERAFVEPLSRVDVEPHRPVAGPDREATGLRSELGGAGELERRFVVVCEELGVGCQERGLRGVPLMRPGRSGRTCSCTFSSTSRRASKPASSRCRAKCS